MITDFSRVFQHNQEHPPPHPGLHVEAKNMQNLSTPERQGGGDPPRGPLDVECGLGVGDE